MNRKNISKNEQQARGAFMRVILFLSLALTSMSAFANLNLFAGKYTSKVGNGEATVSKVLVTPANLFEPAVYKFVLDISNEKDGIFLEDETLAVSKDGKSLALNTESECDDPGCTYFDQIDVELSVKSGKPSLQVYYHGYQDMEEENNRSREFSRTIKYTKK
jgi:hypothetical protein